MNIVDYADREMLAIDLAQKLAGELRAGLVHEERVTLCVPGGTTPGPIFDDLCAARLDWDRVDVVLNDERWVPETSDRSNTRLLRERLFQDRAAAATMLPLYAEAPEPEAVLDQLSERLEAHLPIQVLLLGMGADMHTASLFPGAERLAEGLSSKAPILLPMRADGVPEARITFSARVLNDAMNKHVVITGAEKRRVIETAMTLPPEEAPIRAVLDGATIHWAE